MVSGDGSPRTRRSATAAKMRARSSAAGSSTRSGAAPTSDSSWSTLLGKEEECFTKV